MPTSREADSDQLKASLSANGRAKTVARTGVK
jgi:hypothetical protein